MSRAQYDTPKSPLAAYVYAEANNKEGVDPSIVLLRDDPATAMIRLYGGHILSARINLPGTLGAQELLYPGYEVSNHARMDPKIRATHFGAPAGPDGFGVGNNHGAARYSTFEKLDIQATRVSLKASLGDLALYRDVLLGQTNLTIVDELRNLRTEDDEYTSMLNHLYLNRGKVPVSKENPMTINGVRLDDVLGKPGATEEILKGETYFWPEFGELKDGATVGMPDGSQINVSASINGDRVDGAWLWSPPGLNAFCLEPIDGVDGDNNRNLIIPAGESATLVVSLAARAAANIS